MTTTLHTALMAAQPIAASDAGAPEWVHLLPAEGAPILTRDGRGPYKVASLQQVIENSLADLDTMVLDENHSTDIAAPKGQSSPARAWFKELQARADGIWGRPAWTTEGRALVESGAYRHISPVIGHAPDGTIHRILRASLVNRPNLRGLTALHQESDMTLLERLAEVLGLQAEASETEVVAAVTGLKGEKGGDAVALQSQLAEIGTVLGAASGDAPTVLAAARKAAAGDTATITSLQAELVDVTTALKSLKDERALEKATGFIDGEIRKGRVGVKPLRDHYISRHMADSASVEKEVAALPILGGGGATSAVAPEHVSTHGELSARELAAKATAHQKKAAENGQTITYAAAVRAVQEGAQ